MKNRHVWLLATLVMATLLCCVLGTGLAADSRTGTLTVRIGDYPDSFGVEVFRIGYPDNVWSLDRAYAGTGVLDAKTTAEMEAAVERVNAIVNSTGDQPEARGATSGGVAVIGNLQTGVYFGRMSGGPDGYTMAPFVFTVPMTQNGSVIYQMTVDPKVEYQASGSIQLRAFKELRDESKNADGTEKKDEEKRTLQPQEFTFTLRTANGRVLQTKRNDRNGNIIFDQIEYTLADLNRQPIRYIIQEESGEDSTVEYDSNTYTVDVRLADNGDGTLEVTQNQGANARIFRNTVRGEKERAPHTLTIYYRYLLTGEEAFPTYTETLWEGDEYNVPSPDLPGYICTLTVVSGVMPDHDMVYWVYYFPLKKGQRLININDLQTPLGLGDIQMHVGVCYE